LDAPTTALPHILRQKQTDRQTKTRTHGHMDRRASERDRMRDCPLMSRDRFVTRRMERGGKGKWTV